jgi:hypothetical protein
MNIFMRPICWLRGHDIPPKKLFYPGEYRMCWTCGYVDMVSYEESFVAEMQKTLEAAQQILKRNDGISVPLREVPDERT